MKLFLNKPNLNRSITLVVACIFLISFSFSQKSEKRRGEHGIGFQIGGTTGHGLTYRYYGNKIGVQVSALPIFLQNNRFLMSTGLTGMYKVAESKRIDLVGYLGGHYFTRQPEKIVEENQPNVNEPNTLLDQHIIAELLTGGSEAYNRASMSMSVGLGGILYSKSRFVNFNFFTGYAVYSLNREPLSFLSMSVGITLKINEL